MLLRSGLIAVFSAHLLVAQAPTVGAPLPRWTPGTLDIHQISTGRGNSALLVFPDGTSLLIDAGAAADGTLPEIAPHPDASRAPGAWIARYVKRNLPDSTAGLDYALITHFHVDHMGQSTPSTPMDAGHRYRLTGMTEVGDQVKIGTMIDRGWPDYAYPAPLTDSTVANYRRFLDAQRGRGLVVERFRPGAADQIRLHRDAARYPAFEVRNIIGNGELWTGSGSTATALYPPVATLAPADRPNENMCSLGLRIRYGPFRYFTGGDLQETPDPGYPAWQHIEQRLADAIGPVDVHVVSHHGSVGAESEAFLRTLASSVLVVPSWGPIHPGPDVVKRIAASRFPPAERLVFLTDLRDAARTVNVQRLPAFAAPPGHVVVRVEPGGARYWVAVLSNDDESGKVTAVKGPFTPPSR